MTPKTQEARDRDAVVNYAWQTVPDGHIDNWVKAAIWGIAYGRAHPVESYVCSQCLDLPVQVEARQNPGPGVEGCPNEEWECAKEIRTLQRELAQALSRKHTNNCDKAKALDPRAMELLSIARDIIEDNAGPGYSNFIARCDALLKELDQ